MNLLTDPWIPAVRRSGQKLEITPSMLTDEIEGDPIVAVDALRPDFNGAVMQLLIGLLQTTFAPANEQSWWQRFEHPPASAELQRAFAQHIEAFEMDGNGPRFMQDLELHEPEQREISTLLIEAPGGNTLRLNADHFVKRGVVQALCPACATMALVTLQTNAPVGGRGHRASLRGGGPLTTLIIPDPLADPSMASLWHACWLNVLDQPSLLRRTGNPDRRSKTEVFPWLAPTRTSETSGGKATTPDDTAPHQVYWATPRRIRLDWDLRQNGACDLCGREAELLTSYQTKSYGVNYKGPWKHPLSPHRLTKDGTPVPWHGQPGGVGYRYWLGLALGEPGDGNEPAAVVSWFHHRSRYDRSARMRLWVFGYDMDNMKARAWSEGLMPIWALDEGRRQEVQDHVRNLMVAAREVAGNLRSTVVSAWFERPSNHRGDTSFLLQAFWSATEAPFYRCLGQLLESPTEDDGLHALETYWAWHRILSQAAEQIFDTWASARDTDTTHIARIAEARIKLRRFNSKKTIRNVLKLDARDRQPAKKQSSVAPPPGH